jgi:hypothetical protein
MKASGREVLVLAIGPLKPVFIGVDTTGLYLRSPHQTDFAYRQGPHDSRRRMALLFDSLGGMTVLIPQTLVHDSPKKVFL